MKDETWSPRPYANEEFLSFDRLKRAVISRVLDRAERVMGEEFPLSPDRIGELATEEWHRAKEALQNSPGAREAFRKYLEGTVGSKVDNLIKTDKDYLSAMGVAEKSL
ncbi:MAG: hypothetical protein A2Z36_01270 [Chloroflexi bacterium RBG_19FT_COMBO_48_23]|nr:MAG: hypothetical protein A2Z36_01270 [Chloroflexi bacterium RBG_19FT_COMBO_48_23]